VDAVSRALIGEALGREIVREVAAALGRAAIVVMPLKGVWLQACVYRQPGVRAITDVDVLVAGADYARALALLQAEGWRTRAWNVAETALEHPRWPLPLDLHRALFTPGAFSLPEAGVLARGTRDEQVFGVPVLLPDPRDALAHLVGHFVKSRREASDERAARDFAALASSGALLPTDAASHLVRAGMARAARYALASSAQRIAFYRTLLAALPPDPMGERLVAAAGWLASKAGAHSKLGAAPGFLLDRSLGAGARALLRRVGDLPLDRAASTNPPASSL
jgi:hypothetical protein